MFPSEGISHAVVYGDVYKLRQVEDTVNYFSLDSKIVSRLRRRKYESVIIDRTIHVCLVLGTFTYPS